MHHLDTAKPKYYATIYAYTIGTIEFFIQKLKNFHENQLLSIT